MNQVCKSVCGVAHRCLAHKVTTNLLFRDHELVDGEPELMKDGAEDCHMFWDAREDDTDSH